MKNIKNNKIDVLSDGDIEKIGNLLDNRLEPIESRLDLMATKQDLNNVKVAEGSLKYSIDRGAAEYSVSLNPGKYIIDLSDKNYHLSHFI